MNSRQIHLETVNKSSPTDHEAVYQVLTYIMASMGGDAGDLKVTLLPIEEQLNCCRLDPTAQPWSGKVEFHNDEASLISSGRHFPMHDTNEVPRDDT